jgi:hypothetical protein
VRNTSPQEDMALTYLSTIYNVVKKKTQQSHHHHHHTVMGISFTSIEEGNKLENLFEE